MTDSSAEDICDVCGSKMIWEGFGADLSQNEAGEVVSEYTEFVLTCNKGHEEATRLIKVYGLPPMRMVGPHG